MLKMRFKLLSKPVCVDDQPGKTAFSQRPGGRLFALFVQFPRPDAADGEIQGPPYHCDVNAMRALFPEPRWSWPKPPYPRTTHPRGLAELAVVLDRAT